MSEYDYKPSEDVVNLSRVLTLGVVVSLFLAIVFSVLYLILTPGVTIKINIFGDLYALCYIGAFFAVFYALLLLVAKDDSNVMRLLSLIYALVVLGVLINIIFASNVLNLGSFILFSLI